MDRVRLQYLEALGIETWVRRDREVEAPAASAFLKVSPGRGGEPMFVCDRPDQAGSRLASDLARSCRGAPAWSWPDDGEDCATMEEVLDERSPSTVLVFGEALAERLFGAATPDQSGGARILVAAGLETLESSAAARRDCWQLMVRGGLARPQ